MSTTALATQAPKEIQQWKSPGQVKQRLLAIQQLMKDVLQPGTKENDYSGDYGIIPGTGKKPSLWKAGSEQILAMFEIAVEPVVEDLSTEDCYRYRVTTRLTHAPTGNFLGAGVGEASTDETKYKWKRTYNKLEFENTPADRRRIKYSQYKDSNGMWKDTEEMQVRQEPADLANTILKMAKKRSQIDATLTVTGASSMFDQDTIEEGGHSSEPQSDSKKTRGKAKATGGDVLCSECRAVNGHLPSCKFRQQDKAEKKQEPVQQTIPAEEKKTPSGAEKMVLQIVSVQDMLKKADKTGKRAPYKRMEVVNKAGEQFFLYVWHETPQAYLTENMVSKYMVCEFTVSKKADGSPFCSLETIHELDGVQFVDNKPVVQQEAPAEQEGEDW